MHNETSFNTKFLCFKSKEIEDFKNCKTMQILKNHNFLYAVSILIPGLKSIPENLYTVDNLRYFTISQLNIAAILQPCFLEAFINRGQMSMISVNTRLHQQSTFCIVSSGFLILNLIQDHYECLGLVGKRAFKVHKNKQNNNLNEQNNNKNQQTNNKFKQTENKQKTKVKEQQETSNEDQKKPFKSSQKDVKYEEEWTYIVEIDLKKKNKRLLNCFENFKLPFDCVFNWIPSSSDIDQRSPQAYLLAQGYLCKEMQLMRTEHTQEHNNIPHPLLLPPHQFIEWLGVTLCDGFYGNTDSYENAIQNPCYTQNTTFNKYRNHNSTFDIAVVNLHGFLPGSIVSDIISNLKTYMREADVPWICINNTGFQDSVVAWKKDAHSHKVHGDNAHTIVLTNECTSSFITVHNHSISSLFS